MAVLRVVSNIGTGRIEAAHQFYAGILDMSVVMDLGWIVTFGAEARARPQVSVSTEGTTDTPVPDVSIEVDNFDEVYRRVVEAALPVEYGPLIESWGVRRFFVKDPFGRLVNILAHE